MGTTGYFSSGKGAGRESDHSPPTSAEVKYMWSYISTPPIQLYGIMLNSGSKEEKLPLSYHNNDMKLQ
jgi:hypothetical protein